MKIVAEYSFNKGERAVQSKYPALFKELQGIIGGVNATVHKNKISKEKTMRGQKLYSPVGLNNDFKIGFKRKSWIPIRVTCDYPTNLYVTGYQPPTLNKGAFREMDFVKEKLGIELQFGKYAFMVYNVCAKMTIFKNLGHIDTGIEIVPVKQFADNMSSGVSYFEQFAWDLKTRGVSNIDIPVWILGIDS